MVSPLDTTALDTYARGYAARLCEGYFDQHETVDGPRLLEFSDVPQVNLFLVRALYETWKADALAFRSPYFDFENEEVKTALQSLMNVASQHISVQREAFEPLLTTATAQTLTLLLEPKAYFESYLRDRPDFVLRADDLKTFLRYVRLHRAILQGLAERLDGQESTYVSQALTWLNELTADAHLADEEEVATTLAQFSATLLLDKDSLYKTALFFGEEAVINPPKATRSFFDLTDEELPVASKPVRQPVTPAPPVEVPGVDAPSVDAPVPEPVTVSESDYSNNGRMNGHAESSLSNRLNEQFQSDQPTINDVLAKESPGETLGDQFQKKATESIHQSISLNQKFTFINQLFNGDSVAYHIAIDDLEHCRNFSEAKELMNRVYGPKYHWRMNPDEADEFYELVQRRFQG